jgi:hypothetical protein
MSSDPTYPEDIAKRILSRAVELERRIAETLKNSIDIWTRRTAIEPVTTDHCAHATPAH